MVKKVNAPKARQQQRREQFFAMIDAVHARNAEVPSEVIEEEIAEVVQAIRQEEMKKAKPPT